MRLALAPSGFAGAALFLSRGGSLLARATRVPTTARAKASRPACALAACHNRTLSTVAVSSDGLYASFVKKVEGEVGKEGFAITYADADSGSSRSPWHDVPLHPSEQEDGVYTFLCECCFIPTCTARAKVNLSEEDGRILHARQIRRLWLTTQNEVWDE